MRRRERIQYKTPDQVRLMRLAGLIVADALDAVRAGLTPGATTADLDAIANDVIVSAGAVPSFLNYGYPPYPATLCVSVNEEVVHGIPGGRVLRAGDVVSVDCGAILAGWHGDAAFTAVVPALPGSDRAGDRDERTPVQIEQDDALIAATQESCWRGIAAIAAGDRLNAIGAAVEDYVGERFGLVEEFGGHGIGTEMHQDPHVLNYRTRDRGPRLKAGICLAVEPMLTLGDPATKVLADDWTVSTLDGRRAAHWEHSVALLTDGLWVLTARDGGVGPLTALGVKVSALAG